MNDIDRTCRNSGLNQVDGTTAAHPADRAGFSNRLRLFIFGLFAAIYFLSFLQRVAVSVVADDLVIDLGLDSVALGFMSSGFFISYAITQPVMGFLCDKAGPVRVSAGALVIAAVGSFLFAGAKGFTQAFLGRILMGFGLSAGFIPGMKVISVMFPPETFSTYSSLFVAIGNTGSLMGAAPLSWLTALAGWRPVFRALAALAVVLAALCLIFAKRLSTRKAPDSDSVGEPGSYSDLIRSRELWLLALFMFAKYGSQVAFQGLWGIPYISSVYNVNLTSAASALTMMAVGYVLAAPVIGKLADTMAARGTDLMVARWRLLIATTLIYVITWVPIVLAPGILPFNAMYVLLFIMGMSVSSATLVFGIAKSLFPEKISGFVIGLVNVMGTLGAAVMPPLVGWFMERLTAQGFQGGAVYSKALGPCLVGAALCLTLISLVGRQVRKSPDEELERDSF